MKLYRLIAFVALTASCTTIYSRLTESIYEYWLAPYHGRVVWAMAFHADARFRSAVWLAERSPAAMFAAGYFAACTIIFLLYVEPVHRATTPLNEKDHSP